MVLQSVGFDYRLPREELKAADKALETENKESSGENREVKLGSLKWQDKLGKRKARSRKFTNTLGKTSCNHSRLPLCRPPRARRGKTVSLSGRSPGLLLSPPARQFSSSAHTH